MDDSLSAKPGALAELQARAAQGRQILLRPIATQADLEAAQQARIDWGLGNKKLIYQLFGESAGQVRFSSSPDSADFPLKPQLEDYVREFQTLMIRQISEIERLILVLSRME
jgi:hypothetical protein